MDKKILSRYNSRQGADSYLEKFERSRLEKIFFELGKIFRRLHENGFFVYSPHTRNILIRQETAAPDQTPRLRLLDLPYARFVSTRPAALQAQKKDLGILLKRLVLSGDAGLPGAFYQAYLPDPLGAPKAGLKQRVRRSAAVQDDQTTVAEWEHFFKKNLKKFRKTNLN